MTRQSRPRADWRNVGETHGGGFAKHEDATFCFGLGNDFRIRCARDGAREQAPAELLVGGVAGIGAQEKFGWVASACEAEPALDQTEKEKRRGEDKGAAKEPFAKGRHSIHYATFLQILIRDSPGAVWAHGTAP